MTALHAYALQELDSGRPDRRFDHVVITSVYGDPLDGRTWSGAPSNLANAFRRLGISTVGVSTRHSRGDRFAGFIRHVMGGCGWPGDGEQLRRSREMRRRAALRAAAAVARLGVKHVLHTGTLDLPAIDLGNGVKHYLYCDQSWLLSLRFRPDVAHYNAQALRECERLERQSLCGLEHIFTFGEYVRSNLIEHYGVPADRVTTVGSGMGPITPYMGPKDYAKGRLLFVAKHLFRAKGGELLTKAFLHAVNDRPGLSLTIVGDERSRRLVPQHPQIVLKAHVPWAELQRLYRRASLLVQPMLNDPWGQVYLEALASRTPVLGLNRNGLPEILEGGKHGFLVEEPDPDQLAEAILKATANPDRMAEMGKSGQRHILNAYSWDRVAARIARA